jgi:ABC-type uncharacterized transport system permease subunit
VSIILTYLVIQLIFGLYSLNYIIPKTALSWPNSKILKFTITLCLLILTYTGFVFILITLSLYSTKSPKIVTKV